MMTGGTPLQTSIFIHSHFPHGQDAALLGGSSHKQQRVSRKMGVYPKLAVWFISRKMPRKWGWLGGSPSLGKPQITNYKLAQAPLLRSLETNADTPAAFLPSLYSQMDLRRRDAHVGKEEDMPQTLRCWMCWIELWLPSFSLSIYKCSDGKVVNNR